MRLLTLDDQEEPTLTRFPDEDATPCYAILSHTWGPDQEEVTFKDIKNGSGKTKAGFHKIRFCSDQAKRNGLQYIWIDTCCIDKSSSSELQESITSMYRWYQRASRCYVYLADVSAELADSDDRSQPWLPAFQKSRWFTRGWTLQELLAPTSVQFFSQEGMLLGDKKNMENEIHEITNVPLEALRGAPLTHFSTDLRLSWAEKRKTTRKEDRAYCLLGIFNVFMPLMYGEGENAFVRLKVEIDAISKNQQPQSSPPPRLFGGLSYADSYDQMMSTRSTPNFTNPWAHQSHPTGSTLMYLPLSAPSYTNPWANHGTSTYGQNHSSTQDTSFTTSHPTMSYAQYLPLQQQHQQTYGFPAHDHDASRGALAKSTSAFDDITPRNIYVHENRVGRSNDQTNTYSFPTRSSDQVDEYGAPTLRRSPSISSINSVHSEISEHDKRGNVTKRTVTTTTTTYYANNSRSASGCSSAAVSESENTDRTLASRTLPRPSGSMVGFPPASQSMMGQFKSKMSSNTQRKHKCKVCDKRFTRASALQTHMYSHTGEKPFACDVEGCGRHFSVVSNLRRHKKVHRGQGENDPIDEYDSV